MWYCKISGNSFENILKSGVTSRGVGFYKSRIVFLPEHFSQTSPLPADEEGGSSHLLQSEITRTVQKSTFVHERGNSASSCEGIVFLSVQAYLILH